MVVALQAFGELIDMKIATTATTGVAASRVRGQTAHSFFNLPVSATDPKDKKAAARSLENDKKHFAAIMQDRSKLERLAKLDGCCWQPLASPLTCTHVLAGNQLTSVC